MLSIGKLGAGQERYYTEKVAEGAEDYYSGEGEAEGYWLGDAAGEFAVEGEVTAAQLTAMLTGRNPATGEALGLREVPGRGPVPGFDLTFSAPKSVSLTWALAGHPLGAEVKAAHAASVKAALDYLQREACWTRRGAGGHEFVHGSGFLAAAYVHRSSRAGDPQLHTHVLIANATQGPDGRWTRLYHPAIYDHAKTAGYIYEAHLRDELTWRLGVEWGEVRKGIAEIEGFGAEQLGAFSTRRREILEATAVDASMSARRIATLETRKAKERDLTDESLRERWRVTAAEVGLDREAVRATMGRERQAPEGTVAIADLEAELTAHASTFDRRAVIQAVAQGLPAGAPGQEVEELADSYLALDSVVPIGASAKGERFTTAAIWELEQRALRSAEQMAARSDRAVAGEILAARVIAERPSLKPDQRQMVERLLTGGEGLAIVVGEAGAGKTYAVVAAASGWTVTGAELRVAAPTWRAANVLRSEGLDATSVARLLAELDRQAAGGDEAMPAGSVLMIDEAGMVDSRALARLVDHAQASEAKLVLIGDPAQLGEIEAGGLFAALVERSDPIVLDEVIRHRHELEREAAKLIRAGEGAEAIGVYRSDGRVVVSSDPESRRVEMVNDWWCSYREGEDALMVAKRNAEVAKLNALARELMRAEGRLGGEEIQVGEARFAAGDLIITRVNDQRAEVFNRERWRVAEVDAEARRVILDGIDTPRQVCVDAVYLGRVNPRDGAAALQHAYAATTYQAQGATVDRAYVMADPSMDRQEFYVAASRSREQTYFYATPEVQLERQEYAPASPYLREGLQHIAEAAERDGAQVAAHDAALRSSLGRLPDAELVARREQLWRGAGEQRISQERRDGLAERIAQHQRGLAEVRARLERLGEPGRFAGRGASNRYRQELGHLRDRERRGTEYVARLRAELAELPAAEVRHNERAEAAVIDYVLAERGRRQATALRISPPTYIANEIGERPVDPSKAQHWDRAAGAIQGYRREHGISDTRSALGAEPKDAAARAARERARRSIELTRRRLETQRQRERTQQIERDMSIGL